MIDDGVNDGEREVLKASITGTGEGALERIAGGDGSTVRGSLSKVGAVVGYDVG